MTSCPLLTQSGHGLHVAEGNFGTLLETSLTQYADPPSAFGGDHEASGVHCRTDDGGNAASPHHTAGIAPPCTATRGGKRTIFDRVRAGRAEPGRGVNTDPLG